MILSQMSNKLYNSYHPSPAGQMIGILLFAFCILFSAFDCYADSFSSSDLIRNAYEYDGREVIYQGEVIGEIMRRGEHAWVNISDGQNALGVWIGGDLLEDISFVGRYKTKGDIVEIKGIFNRACPEHGGDLDIHSKEVKKIQAGKLVPEKFAGAKQKLIFYLSGILAVIWILRRLKTR